MKTSNGKTPKEQISQILDFAPVLPRSMMQGHGKQEHSSQTTQSAAPIQRQSHQSSTSSFSHPIALSSSTSSQTGPRQFAHTSAAPKQDLHDLSGPKVKRQDSITDELDEFEDAKG